MEEDPEWRDCQAAVGVGGSREPGCAARRGRRGSNVARRPRRLTVTISKWGSIWRQWTRLASVGSCPGCPGDQRGDWPPSRPEPTVAWMRLVSLDMVRLEGHADSSEAGQARQGTLRSQAWLRVWVPRVWVLQVWVLHATESGSKQITPTPALPPPPASLLTSRCVFLCPAGPRRFQPGSPAGHTRPGDAASGRWGADAGEAQIARARVPPTGPWPLLRLLFPEASPHSPGASILQVSSSLTPPRLLGAPPDLAARTRLSRVTADPGSTGIPHCQPSPVNRAYQRTDGRGATGRRGGSVVEAERRGGHTRWTGVGQRGPPGARAAVPRVCCLPAPQLGASASPTDAQ